MKTIILYREHSDHAREVETFISDLKRVSGQDVETLDVDTRDGADFARLYDIVQYPAAVVTRDDGTLQKMWQGREGWPTINDVEYFLKRF